MYLWKQWRESRIVSSIGLLGLTLLFVLVMEAVIKADPSHSNGNHEGLAMLFVPIFYLEAALIGFWGWLIGSIGAGKNLGEDSGSFLFTRPRSRAWFVWNDWGFGMVLLAVVIVLSNLMVGILCYRLFEVMHLPPTTIQLTYSGQSIPLMLMMGLISVGVMLFAGLVYSLTYFSTVMIKRTSGVLLGAGIFFGYLVLRALLSHYFPSIQLPSPIPNLFNFDHHTFQGFSNHLGLTMLARGAVMLLFPVAAQVILDRSEI